MSSTFSTVTFYVAPSKERHPLVSQLLRSIDAGRDGRPRVAKVTRVGGFLTGTFELCDGDWYDEEFQSDWPEDEDVGDQPSPARVRYEETKQFFDLYRRLGDLGYISQNHRYSWWSGNGDHGSDWEEGPLDHHEYQEFLQKEEKRKLKLFWQEYPNLMGMIKSGHPADVDRSTS